MLLSGTRSELLMPPLPLFLLLSLLPLLLSSLLPLLLAFTLTVINVDLLCFVLSTNFSIISRLFIGLLFHVFTLSLLILIIFFSVPRVSFLILIISFLIPSVSFPILRVSFLFSHFSIFLGPLISFSVFSRFFIFSLFIIFIILTIVILIILEAFSVALPVLPGLFIISIASKIFRVSSILWISIVLVRCLSFVSTLLVFILPSTIVFLSLGGQARFTVFFLIIT